MRVASGQFPSKLLQDQELFFGFVFFGFSVPVTNVKIPKRP